MIGFRALTADEVELRTSRINENCLELLVYKTARTDMDLLDEVLGAGNWECSFSEIKGHIVCTLRLWDETKQRWIEKCDVGTESNMEATKGEFSDARKRAGFVAGIGRELYTAPEITIWKSDCNIKKNKNDKYVCYDVFRVSRMNVIDGHITALEVTNDTTGKRVFKWPKEALEDATRPQTMEVAGITFEEEPEKKENELMPMFRKAFKAWRDRMGMTTEEAMALCMDWIGKPISKDLTAAEVNTLLDYMRRA